MTDSKTFSAIKYLKKKTERNIRHTNSMLLHLAVTKLDALAPIIATFLIRNRAAVFTDLYTYKLVMIFVQKQNLVFKEI